MTPNQLADQLDVNPKTLRAYLRKEFPRDAEAKNSRWEITKAQVAKAEKHFQASDEKAS
jgi:hypothetical protein